MGYAKCTVCQAEYHYRGRSVTVPIVPCLYIQEQIEGTLCVYPDIPHELVPVEQHALIAHLTQTKPEPGDEG